MIDLCSGSPFWRRVVCSVRAIDLEPIGLAAVCRDETDVVKHGSGAEQLGIDVTALGAWTAGDDEGNRWIPLISAMGVVSPR